MRRYYDILGIRYGASSDEIRRAYRRLAMLYHPDRNSTPEAAQKFLLIKEAYEKLSENPYATGFEARQRQESMHQSEAERRERVYKVWVEHQQKQARYRQAYGHMYSKATSGEYQKRYKAKQQAKEEETTPLIKLLHLFTNVFFMFLFAGILVVPIYRYFEQLSLPPHQQRNILFFIIPALLGVLFLCFGYYYWFSKKSEE